jgi:hypothetical protein
MSGVESGNAAPLVGGPPGTELQTVVEELPSGAVAEMLPVAEVTNGVGIVPSAAVDGIAFSDAVGANAVVVTAVVPGVNVGTVLAPVDGTGTAAREGDGRGGNEGGCGAGNVVPGKSVANDVAGCADSDNGGATVDDTGAVDAVGAANVDSVAGGVADIVDIDTTGTTGVPGVICPDGVAQVTTVPGVVGSDASGTDASVVSGAPGCVVTENGLGPLSGEDWMAPGVDGRPMAVVPMVETCARQA